MSFIAEPADSLFGAAGAVVLFFIAFSLIIADAVGAAESCVAFTLLGVLLGLASVELHAATLKVTIAPAPTSEASLTLEFTGSLSGWMLPAIGVRNDLASGLDYPKVNAYASIPGVNFSVIVASRGAPSVSV